MSIRHAIVLAVFALVAASCDDEKKTKDPVTTVDETTESTDEPAPSLESAEPPAPRLALPPALRTIRLSDDDVGTISDPKTPTRKMNGFGLASCQTGWTFQGLYFNDDGTLVATAPFTIGLATVPTGRQVRYVDPDIPNRALSLDFSQFGLDRVTGTVRVLDTASNDDVLLEMTVDGPPTSLVRAPGLGPAGCFDTGFWKATAGDDDVFGPALGVYDPANLHYVGLRISPTENIVLLFTLKPGERGRGDVINTSFAKIEENPELIPVRGYVERRVNRSDTGSKTGPVIEIVELPIEQGDIIASFPTGKVAGPMRIALKNVVLPEWDSDWSGVTIEKLRAEVLFVTDTKGEEVPLPSRPDWFERPPVVLP